MNGWLGERGKATLATAPNADIMQEVSCTLRTRIEAGGCTFLVKVKSQRGEPINEQVDDMAEENRLEHDDARVWTTRPESVVFRKAREHRCKGSAWTKGVRNIIRGQASEAVLNTAWQEAADRWFDYVCWRRRQPSMEHVAGLEHNIRQEGIGDRVAGLRGS